MRLATLELRDFRNVASAALELSPRATVLVGENGQGKTNLLEAVYLLCTLRPLRAGRLAELVRFGEARALVAGDFDGPGGLRRAAVEVADGARTALLDGKPVAPGQLDDYFEGRAAVCFSPEDLLLVKGGPELRRRFLDRAAFNRWPAVLGEAREYLRALRSRNAALRAEGPAEVEESFRAPLVRAAARLVRRRLDLVRELAPRLARAFAEILALRLPRDRERGYTSAGPHMDDLTLALDERGARPYASQGQQRALVLGLKIGEIENLRAALGRPPLLLLDDVSSELDPRKNRHLLDYLSRLPGQAILTATDRRLLDPAAGPEAVFYGVRAGVFERLIS